ncbi:endonuclease domain-containing protein [Streptomyces sp. NPDC058653]|uniref:endonuclease domain-containing protein n=1 Tax=Streptomyces sp. NPDC058653 TaxID=3346576 RepID=UPI0036683A04
MKVITPGQAAHSHAPPRSAPCAHKAYELACDDYDRLIEHARGVCEICGIAPEQTGHGFLVVDHDATVGQWAVRGLLCSDCNSALPCGSSPGWAREYLAHPWWKIELERQGASADTPDEPPIGSLVTTGYLNFRRTAAGWENAATGYSGSARNWAGLNRRYGPHNLRRIMAPEVKDPSKLPREERRAYVVASLQAGVRPTEVARASGWTDSHVRKMAREAGIEPDERYEERAARLRKQPTDQPGSPA